MNRFQSYEIITIIIPILFLVQVLFSSVTISKPPKGVYIHIPFCRRRCFYCDFPIKVIGDRPSTQEIESEVYTNLLERDIDISRKQYDHDRRLYPLETVYFGGGTPSLLSLSCLERLLRKLDQSFGITKDTEITLEMDPGTFHLEKLKNILSLGVNRISLGVQSFDDHILELCGRAHRTIDTYRAISDLNVAEVNNYSIDLISSLPSLTINTWLHTLQQTISSGCHHVSVYDLQIEDKTAFGRWYTPGIFPLPTELMAAEMYTMAVKQLTSVGFEHYEISNYGKPNRRSKHNQKYWKCEDVYGFGMASAALIHGKRFLKPKKMQDYIDWIENQEKENENKMLAVTIHSHSNSKNRTAEEDLNQAVDIYEVVMLSLRTCDGLDFNHISRRFGSKYTKQIWKFIQPYVYSGHVEILPIDSPISNHPNNNKDNNDTNSITIDITDIQGIRLSDPKGFLISNDIISSVFAELSKIEKTNEDDLS